MSFERNQAAGAYRRWEPPNFDAPAEPVVPPEAMAAPEPAPHPEPVPEPTPPEPEQPRIKLPTAEDIERIHEAAHKEGYAAGYEEGTARGRMEALQLHTLVENFDKALTHLDQEVAEEILALSIEVARQMVQKSLKEQPALVVDVVREALHQLPQGHALIHLNPEDAQLVRDYLGEQLQHNEHRLVEDESISRGGCQVESAGSMVDATVQTRWRRIMENLNREDTDWEAQD